MGAVCRDLSARDCSHSDRSRAASCRRSGSGAASPVSRGFRNRQLGSSRRVDAIFAIGLRRVTRNSIVNALSRRPKDLAVGGSSVQHLLAQHRQNDPETVSLVDWEYRRELYLQAPELLNVMFMSTLVARSS